MNNSKYKNKYSYIHFDYSFCAIYKLYIIYKYEGKSRRNTMDILKKLC